MKMKWFWALTIIVLTLSVVNIYNITQYKFFSLIDFINKKCHKQYIDSHKDYKLFFIVSPFRCEACTDFLTKNDSLVIKLKKQLLKKGKNCQINFIVTGDFNQSDKINYLSNIKNIIDEIYLDNSNSILKFMLVKFQTPRIPLLIIYDKYFKVLLTQPFPSLSQTQLIDQFEENLLQTVEKL